MKLYAVKSKDERKVEVFDDGKRCFIRKTDPSGRITRWYADRTAKVWVGLQKDPSEYLLENGTEAEGQPDA